MTMMVDEELVRTYICIADVMTDSSCNEVQHDSFFDEIFKEHCQLESLITLEQRAMRKRVGMGLDPTIE
jgi:hypothetical protein